ncbi:MAG: diguanylate cyclase [Eubacteriaceae bacterium]|nr:diguanylate cyclase [Eubacteriaceae bacterium]
MHDLLEQIKQQLLYAGLSKEDYIQIIHDMQRENRKCLMTFTAISDFFLLVMIVLSFFSKTVATNRMVYLFILIALAVIYVTAKSVKGNRSDSLIIATYAFIAILFIFGIILGTVTIPEERTVTFIALLLTVPLLFTDRPARMVTCISVSVIVFILAALNSKPDNILVTDITNAMVFGTISVIVSTYMMRVKCQKFLYARKISVLSETDILTGLRNRNSYEKAMKKCSSMNHTMSCIYVDVNGLHEMNNSQGHEAGDAMLRFVGKTLMDEFGKDSAFRIGGDEFVVFVRDENELTVHRKLERIKALAETNSYYLSVGCVTEKTSEMDVLTMIRNAEKKMFEEKRLYYQQSEKDRRRRY